MTNLLVNIVNAFTDAGTGGNPAGVVLNADALSPQQKQKIAGETGSSETAFVSKSRAADFMLEFFTPTRQIAHCGHATIATFSYLAQQGLLSGPTSSKETIDGTRRIFLDEDMAFMEQTAPSYTALEAADLRLTMKSLGVDRRALLQGYQPMVVNTGNSFMLVPLKDETVLKSLKPDLEAIEHISEKFDLIGFYPFSIQTQVPGREAAARMFAPRYGILEESATGMAAGPLACYLFDQLCFRKEQMVIEQGRMMTIPSPSELIIRLNVEDGRITNLLAGGRAKLMRSINIEIE